MKTTSQQCFSNGTNMMIWQERNCCQCKKAVFYNTKLGRMPQYRCAIQKQIEGQANGELEINQRSFDATQGKECPFFKNNEETDVLSVPNYENFAKGESLVKVTKESAVNEPKSTEKEVFVKIGNDLVPEKEAKEAEKRMFATIQEKMNKGELPPVFTEEQFREDVNNGVQEMLESFTWKENMMISFIPLLIANIAWTYTDKVLQFCVENRISEVKKLGRTVKEVRQRYMNTLKKDLDPAHIANIEEQTNKFMTESSKNFTIFWFTVNGAIKLEYPDAEYTELMTDAFCGYLMIDFLRQHNKRMDKLIASKMGQSNSIMHPDMVALQRLLDAYLPEGFEVKDRCKIDLALKIIGMSLENIDFEIVKEPGKNK